MIVVPVGAAATGTPLAGMRAGGRRGGAVANARLTASLASHPLAHEPPLHDVGRGWRGSAESAGGSASPRPHGSSSNRSSSSRSSSTSCCGWATCCNNAAAAGKREGGGGGEGEGEQPVQHQRGTCWTAWRGARVYRATLVVALGAVLTLGWLALPGTTRAAVRATTLAAAPPSPASVRPADAPLPRSMVAVVWVQPHDAVAWLDALPYGVVAYSDRLHASLAPYPSESAPYLDYLCRTYDALPYATLFLHGHAADAQRPPDVLQVAEAVRQGGAASVFRAFGTSVIGPAPILGSDLANAEGRLWQAVLGRYLHASRADYSAAATGTPCCGEFVVTAARIQARPKALYCDLLDYLLHYVSDDPHTKALVMNRVWPALFSSLP